MKEELAKRYNPPDFEQRIYAAWEKGQFFTPLLDRERPKFSIVIPPPNVTGRLHIGHALVNSLQDVVVRWKRISTSCSVLFSAWPMCSEPVTFGGGMTIANGSASGSSVGAKAPERPETS